MQAKFFELEAEENESDEAIATVVRQTSVSRQKNWDETDQIYRCSVCSWEWEGCQCAGDSDDESASMSGRDSAGLDSDEDLDDNMTDDSDDGAVSSSRSEYSFR